MPDQNIIKYISEQRGAGFSDESIKNALVKSGYSMQDISQYFPSAPQANIASSRADGIEVPVGLVCKTAFIPFNPKASRIEVIVRIIWLFLIQLVSLVYALIAVIIILLTGIVAYILLLINILTSFLLGRRMRASFNWSAKFINASVRWSARLSTYSYRRVPYIMYMLDKRPSLGMEPPQEPERGGSVA